MRLSERLYVRLIVIVIVLSALSARAADWPGYRCDKARRGGTSEQVGSSLSLEWVYSSVYAPRAAWGGRSAVS